MPVLHPRAAGIIPTGRRLFQSAMSVAQHASKFKGRQKKRPDLEKPAFTVADSDTLALPLSPQLQAKTQHPDVLPSVREMEQHMEQRGQMSRTEAIQRTIQVARRYGYNDLADSLGQVVKPNLDKRTRQRSRAARLVEERIWNGEA